jgi:hypothetical protein
MTTYFKSIFLKTTFLNCFLIMFGGVRNSTHFGILLLRSFEYTCLLYIFEYIVKLLMKLKNFSNYDVISNAHQGSDFLKISPGRVRSRGNFRPNSTWFSGQHFRSRELGSL